MTDNLNISSHRDRAGNFFPPSPLPKLAAARIITGHQDNDALDPGPAQPLQAFVHQTLANSASLISRIDRQMINVSAASIVTAQRDANNRRPIGCYAAQTRIPPEKLSDAFFVISLRDLDTFHPLPQFNRRVVIVDRKFSGIDLASH
jgi:hypothetical protein